MKNCIVFLACLALPQLRAAEIPAATVSAAKPLAFATHDGYFVSNKFEPAAPVSCVVITDQSGFDHVFGVGMVMHDKSHRLPAGAFAKKLVVTAIHRGKAMLTYHVESVTAAAQTLIVTYTTTSRPDATAEFACPLIVSLDRGDFNTVRFVEDGKELKSLPIPPVQAAR